MKHNSSSPFLRPAISILSALLVCAICPPVCHAQTLMFDFGPTSPTGSNLTNSPAHFAGTIGGAATTWNIVGTSDISSGLLYADGSAASGISIATGPETSDTSNILNFSLNPGFSSALGSQINTGIYSGDSVAKDGIFNTTTAAYAVGVQIGGLAPGNYQVFLSGRNTNVSGSYPQNFYTASSATGTTFDFNSLTPVSVTNSGTAWAQGTTYAMFNVAISSGQVLNIATSGTGIGAAGRGFLNSVQVVAVPEPGVAGLLSVGALLIVLRRRQAGL